MKNKLLLITLGAAALLSACGSGGGTNNTPQYMTPGNYTVSSILGPAANSSNIGQAIGETVACSLLDILLPVVLLQTTASVDESGNMVLNLIPSGTAELSQLNIKANPCGQFSSESDTYTFKNCIQVKNGGYQFLTYDANQSPNLESAGCDIYTHFTPSN